jgi:hypothetical protein
METTKMAKCNIYKYSFCTHKHDAPECKNCVLIKRREHLYKFINGRKYKKCPHCEEYKPINEFKTNSKGHKSWCNDCHKEYSRERYRSDNKSFIVAHRIDEHKKHMKFDSVAEMIKFIRKCIDLNVRLIEIKRI